MNKKNIKNYFKRIKLLKKYDLLYKMNNTIPVSKGFIVSIDNQWYLKKIKYLLKEKGLTLKGAKKQLNDEKSDLDEFNKDHINTKSNFKIKVKNISKLIKKLKD